MLRRLACTRSLHYLVIGGVLYLLDPWNGARPGPAPADDAREIVITEADRQRLRDDWRRQYGDEPSPERERARIAEAIDEEILYREALALGLDRDDRVIRRRLARVASFVGEEGERSDEELARRARRLGLDRSDVVVRRYLVRMMRLVASRPTRDDLPAERDIEAYFARHRERFRQPQRFHLTHVHLSRDRRGPTLEHDAMALLEQLRATRPPRGENVALGDPFIRDNEMRAISGRDLERAFGPAFVAALEDIPVGEWSGPVPSTYGLHLVWIHERIPSRIPPLTEVRNQVVHGLLRERQQARFRKQMAQWRARYTVRVPDDAGAVDG